MAFAKVVGEAHHSATDQRVQSTIEFSAFDAVFTEHHDENLDSLATGSTLLGVPYLATFKLYRRLTEPHYHDRTETVEGNRALEIAVEKNIDLGPLETYTAIWWPAKVLILVTSLLSGIYLAVWIHSLLPTGGPVLPVQLGDAVASLVFAVVVFSMNHGLSELAGSFAREQHMAGEIDRRSTQNGYERVVVICGDHHRPIIAALLEREGWTVEEQPSQSGFAKPFGIYRGLRRLVVGFRY